MRFVFVGVVCALMVGLGLRLLRLARAGGGAPERSLGLFFTVIGVSFAVLRSGAELGGQELLGRGLVALGQGGATLAFLFLIRFTWLVFRSTESWARWLAITLGALDIASYLVTTWIGAAVAMTGPVGAFLIVSRLLILGWTSFETGRYAAQMRRRIPLGLADPVVANRFRLWSLWTGVLAVLALWVLVMNTTGALEMPTPGQEIPASLRMVFAGIASCLFFASVCVWLAFFPPERYQAWLRRRAEAHAA